MKYFCFDYITRVCNDIEFMDYNLLMIIDMAFVALKSLNKSSL